MKKLTILLLAAVMVVSFVLTTDVLCSQKKVAVPEEVVEEGDVVNVGNAICPISGEEVAEGVTYVYEGKEYNFCCSGCIEEFKKDPEKHIKDMKESGTKDVREERKGSYMQTQSLGGITMKKATVAVLLCVMLLATTVLCFAEQCPVTGGKKAWWGKHGGDKAGMMKKMMMHKQMVATKDGGVVVMIGNKLLKYDRKLKLTNEAEIDMQTICKKMMEKCGKVCPMKKTEESALSNYHVPNLTRALRIMELLADESTGLTTAQITEKLSIPRNSVFRVTATLLENGYLVRDEETKNA